MTPEPTAAEAIVVVTTASTFWLRLRLHLRRAARRSPFALGAGLLVALPVVLVIWLAQDNQSPGDGFAGLVLAIEAAGAAAMLVLSFAIACVRSVFRSEAEQRIPAEITFYRDALVVRPKRAQPYETNWTWIQRARHSDDAIVLVIAETPYTELHVARAKLGDAQFATLLAWLERHARFG
jgi:hypothetical protein